mgnify:CR=1 FL=1
MVGEIDPNDAVTRDAVKTGDGGFNPPTDRPVSTEAHRVDAPEPVKLAGLSFVDLYIRLDKPDESRFRPVKVGRKSPANQPVPTDLADNIEALRQKILEIGRDDFGLMHDGVRLRASRQVMANGQHWVALRRVANQVPTLEDLNFDNKLLPLLRELGGRNGLVLVSGATGHGKTTTAIGLLADYLRRQGDLAYTIEDPAEYHLAGEHGDGGYCFQVEAEKDEDWALGLRTALRWHPRYLLVGEVRTPDAANQVLRAANSGHLVITTMHGGSIEEALSSLLQLAHGAIGDRAAQLLADGLVAVLHQTLRSYAPFLRFAVTEGDNPGDPIRSAIRQHKIQLLGTYIDQQEARLFGPGARLRRLAEKAQTAALASG